MEAEEKVRRKAEEKVVAVVAAEAKAKSRLTLKKQHSFLRKKLPRLRT